MDHETDEEFIKRMRREAKPYRIREALFGIAFAVFLLWFSGWDRTLMWSLGSFVVGIVAGYRTRNEIEELLS